MTPEKRTSLEAAGYTIGTAADFLDLSPAENAMVETRLALADALREARTAAGLSQSDLAQSIGSSQSRIAKAERADPAVSIDLMLRALFGTGARPASVLSRKVVRREGGLAGAQVRLDPAEASRSTEVATRLAKTSQ